ncbi:hypothetical protein OG21DRAFT_1518496 [Imleria badia]|nr:hypothetical protein OG21DRAFT_1518496 [Imleria badia]
MGAFAIELVTGNYIGARRGGSREQAFDGASSLIGAHARAHVGDAYWTRGPTARTWTWSWSWSTRRRSTRGVGSDTEDLDSTTCMA